jgi:gliding motility-associated protein GldC
MSAKSTITLEVSLDENKMPETITWSATQSEADQARDARAFMLSLWDPAERSALRIDLWTKKMMVDEMNDFFFQTMMTMSDTYQRATGNEDLVKELKAFARDFYKKAQDKLQTESNK